MEIKQARKQIQDGKIGVYPTETAYGIAADALNQQAIEKVYESKHRPKSKPLTTICYNLEQVKKHAELNENERDLIGKFMPGPLTLVVEKKSHVPDILNESFVFRIPGSETARKLAEKGAITATSANISGEDTSYSVDDISEELLNKVDFVVDEGELSDGPTSTIAEVNDGGVLVHREGPIKKNELESCL